MTEVVIIGKNFQKMIKEDYGIKRKPITVRNPQANAICERVHQVIGNIIRTFELENNYLDEEDPWKGILSATAFAVRSTFHTTLQQTHRQLVFGRDMIFNVKHTANWEYIKQRKQQLLTKIMLRKIQKGSTTNTIKETRSSYIEELKTNMNNPKVGLIQSLK